MILILSKEQAEGTTELVIDWLKYYNISFYRLNGDDLINKSVNINFNLSNGQWSFEIKDKFGINLRSSDIKGVWYRRSFNSDLDNRIEVDGLNTKDSTTLNSINQYLKKEIFQTYSLIQKSLREVFWLNRSNDVKDKFFVLEEAQKLGIKIPFSFVTNNRQYLEKHLGSIQIITKASTQARGFELGGNYYSGMTTKVNKEDVSKLKNDFFLPSFFQEEIQKKYELRIFFLIDTFYPVAIFSQKNSNTSVDFRNYDRNLPNRIERVSIPEELEFKLLNLMSNLNLNSGSIDIMKTVDGEYYFLEVNPVGQFLNSSIQGDFNLERLISEVLIRESYGKEAIEN